MIAREATFHNPKMTKLCTIIDHCYAVRILGEYNDVWQDETKIDTDHNGLISFRIMNETHI